MNRDKEFNTILDECLERLLVKGEAIQQCLVDYPEHAVELEPLLHTASDTSKALAIEPRPEFKARARYQFRQALQQETVTKRRSFFLGWQPRWAIAMAIVVVLLVGGGGTVAAAGDSMPDSILYPVKLATEQVQLKLTPSNLGKAELYAELADKRVAEIVYLVNTGQSEQVEPTAERLNKHLALVVDLSLAENAKAESEALAEDGGSRVLSAPPMALEEGGEEESDKEQPSREEQGKNNQGQAKGRAELRTLLGSNSVENLAELSALLETAPESAKPTLRRIINEVLVSYEKALAALD